MRLGNPEHDLGGSAIQFLREGNNAWMCEEPWGSRERPERPMGGDCF